jgi:hypothetical protein
MEKPSEVPAPLPSLREALRRARMASAEKSGVLVELRTAELARLDLLKDELQPLFAQVPQGVDLFDAAIMPGDPARLFIDVLGFVEMGRDKRTYQFFHDTRYGRNLIAETEDIAKITQAITDYVAHRIVEREKALVSDTVDMKPQVDLTTPVPAPAPAAPLPVEQQKASRTVLVVIAILVGLLVFWATGALWR